MPRNRRKLKPSSKVSHYILLGRGGRKRPIVAEHSLQFHLLVCVSVCPVHCGKTADWMWMRLGIVGRMGPGKNVVGFRDRSTGGVILRSSVGRPIVSNKKLGGSCAKVREPPELRFGVVCGLGMLATRPVFLSYFGQTCYT